MADGQEVVITGGSTGPGLRNRLLVDGTVFGAARTVARPIDHGALGHYAFARSTGILPAALTADAEVFQFRWAAATPAVLLSVTISAAVSTTMFAAGVPLRVSMLKCSAWTVPGTLGLGITPAALLKTDSDMANTLLAAGDMRIATTAALGAGTKTLETEPIGHVLGAGPITGMLNGMIFPPGTPLFEPRIERGEHPLELKANQGFVITVPSVPATGTWALGVAIKWAELLAY